jgi:exopolysaccharide biosynthesis polyprenyl glycosylphosphotransferase
MTSRRTALLALLKLADLAVVAASLVCSVPVAVTRFGGHGWLGVLEMRVSLANVLFAISYLVFWHLVLEVRGLYRSYRLAPASREFRDLLSAVVIGTAPLVPFGIVLGFASVDQYFLLAFPLLTFVGLTVERRVLRTLAARLRRVGRNLRDVVVVGDREAARYTVEHLHEAQGLGYQVVDLIEVNGEGDAEALRARFTRCIDTQPIDEVFFAVPVTGAHPAMPALVRVCEEMGITVRVVAPFPSLTWGRASVDSLAGLPVLTVATGPTDSLRLLLKRTLDLVLGTVALVALSPLFALIALAVKLDSAGPVIFAQERVGRNRRRFKTLKFRTMVPDADRRQAEVEHLNEADGPVFKIEHDPRVTRVGRMLRRTSLDELPQLVNVVLGDMSLVGPRPLPVRDVERMQERWHHRRFSVKPGITCLWQVRRREPKFDEWVSSDMEYIDNWSLALDFKILVQTIPAVLSGHGAH